MRQARRAGDVDPAADGEGTAADREKDDRTGGTGAVTIGQALRGAALSPAADRPVGHADAAALQAAEKSATGQGGGAVVVPGGVAAVAQRAAETNEEAARDGADGEPVTTLRDVLGDASSAVVPGDSRAATFVDAQKVAAASSGTGRVGAGMGAVADALAAAVQMNDGTPL